MPQNTLIQLVHQWMYLCEYYCELQDYTVTINAHDVEYLDLCAISINNGVPCTAYRNNLSYIVAQVIPAKRRVSTIRFR